jgi:hypothetical protein
MAPFLLIATLTPRPETTIWRDSCVPSMSPIHLKTGQKIIK